MATTQPAQHDSTTSHNAQGSPTQASPSAQSSSTAQEHQNPLVSIGQDQVLAILKTLPSIYRAQGDPKDAAEALSSMSQSATAYPHMPPNVHLYQHYPGMDPNSPTHRLPPPPLGQIPAAPPPPELRSPTSDDEGQGDGEDNSPQAQGSSANPDEKPKSSAGRRNGRSATMTNEEWARQRKDNHKEVERRRRGNINEGINELGRIVPNGSGEKAKGAILARAVQYIHHLKENEARNIEKWTLEKLLMDQAMGDLQAQLEEMKRLWEDERARRERAESELEVLKGLQERNLGQGDALSLAQDKDGANSKRSLEDAEHEREGADADERKRQRVE